MGFSTAFTHFLPVKKSASFFRTRSEELRSEPDPEKPGPRFGGGVTGHALRVPAEGESGHRQKTKIYCKE